MPRQSYQRALRPLLRGGAAVLLVAALVVLPSPPSALAAMPSGNQLKLDGANDYANIADNTSLDLGDQEGEDFTIEAFFYVPDETSETNQVIFYKGSAYTLTINFNTATADAIFTNIYTSPVTSSQLLNSTDLATGWHHVAVVYDNEWSETYDRLAIYLDGAEFASSTAFEYTPGIYASTNLLSVGANSGGVPFAGWLDEARFSDVVRYSGRVHGADLRVCSGREHPRPVAFQRRALCIELQRFFGKGEYAQCPERGDDRSAGRGQPQPAVLVRHVLHRRGKRVGGNHGDEDR